MMSDLHSEVHIAMYSESDNPTIVTYACGQVKDKLVEDREFLKNVLIHSFCTSGFSLPS